MKGNTDYEPTSRAHPRFTPNERLNDEGFDEKTSRKLSLRGSTVCGFVFIGLRLYLWSDVYARRCKSDFAERTGPFSRPRIHSPAGVYFVCVFVTACTHERVTKPRQRCTYLTQMRLRPTISCQQANPCWLAIVVRCGDSIYVE